MPVSLYIFVGVNYQDYFCATRPVCTANLIIVSFSEGKTDFSSSSISCVSVLQTSPCGIAGLQFLGHCFVDFKAVKLWKGLYWLGCFQGCYQQPPPHPPYITTLTLSVIYRDLAQAFQKTTTRPEMVSGLKYFLISVQTSWIPNWRHAVFLHHDPHPQTLQDNRSLWPNLCGKKVIWASCFLQPLNHHRPTPGPLQSQQVCERCGRHGSSLHPPAPEGLFHLHFWLSPTMLCLFTSLTMPRWKWGTMHGEEVWTAVPLTISHRLDQPAAFIRHWRKTGTYRQTFWAGSPEAPQEPDWLQFAIFPGPGLV